MYIVSAVLLAVFVYRWVKGFNRDLALRGDEDEAAVRSLDPGTAATITALLPIFGLPYTAYRMYGRVGVLYGFGVWFGYALFSFALSIVFAVLVRVAGL